jgi:heterodisulfide reductase subunit A
MSPRWWSSPRRLPKVVVAREYKFMCSDPGQEMIKQDIRELGVDPRCSGLLLAVDARAHVPEGHRKEAGENPFYFQMANIREHVSWVTLDPQDGHGKGQGAGGGAASPACGPPGAIGA